MSARPTRKQPRQRFRQHRPRQQGVALIMVLLVVAVIAVIATQTSSQIQFDIQKAQNRQQYQQAYWYALGGERLAKGLLELAMHQDNYLHLGQEWANPLMTFPIDGGGISVQLTDQQTCFNPNSMTTLTTSTSGSETATTIERQFQQLLLQLDATPTEVQRLTEPLRDWLDSDTIPTGFNGSEDLHYTALDPAYLPANAALADASELNLIDGFNISPETGDSALLELLDKLRPFLCPLPSNTMVINLNTLTMEQLPLLTALFENKIDSSTLQTLVETRPDDGFKDIDEFWSQLGLDLPDAPAIDAELKSQLAVDSSFFLARIEVSYYDARLILFSRFSKTPDNKFNSYQRRYGGPNE